MRLLSFLNRSSLQSAQSVRARVLVFSLIVNWIVASCSPGVFVESTPTATLTPTTPAALPTFTATPGVPDTGWNLLQPGLERRVINVYNEQGQSVESVYIFRLDQNQFRLDIAYHERPQTLVDWQAETKALLIVNGGYFRIEDEKYIPNGLTIVNGEALGSSYDTFAGMLAIHRDGAELRWLAQQPYDPYEPLSAALQSFPILVKPGGELGFPAEHEDHVAARRTVMAQDREGRLLFIVTPRGYFTLHTLSAYLTGSDLNLDIAINLDGGPSSGILVANPREVIPAPSLLPLVILVYPR